MSQAQWRLILSLLLGCQCVPLVSSCIMPLPKSTNTNPSSWERKDAPWHCLWWGPAHSWAHTFTLRMETLCSYLFAQRRQQLFSEVDTTLTFLARCGVSKEDLLPLLLKSDLCRLLQRAADLSEREVLPQDLSRKMKQSQSASGDRKLQGTAVLLSCWGDLVHPFLRLLPLT